MAQPEAIDVGALERHRGFLLLLARCQVPPWLRADCDPEGAVQQTFLLATKSWHQFRGGPEAALRGWLRTILKNVLLGWQAPQGRAASLNRAVLGSSRRLEKFLADEQSTPSRRLMREEQLVRLADALARLPEDQRQAVPFHHLDGLSNAAVGARMGRSKEAVAGLLFRGLRQLRDHLAGPG
jgi:RNA polymerase sigma-70 factor (ECF subfamily)